MKKMKKIKKPSIIGRPTKEMLEERERENDMRETLSLKKKMAKDLLSKADEMIQKGKTSEGRQCIQSAQQLEQDIKAIEKKLNKEPEEKEQEPEPEEQKDNITDLNEWRKKTVFRPMVMHENGEYEFEDYQQQETVNPVIRRRKPS